MDSTHKIMLTIAAIDAAIKAVDKDGAGDIRWERAVTFLQAALPHLRVLETDTTSPHRDDRQPYPNLLPTRGYASLESPATPSSEVRVPYTGDTPRRGYPTDAGADLRLEADLELPPHTTKRVWLSTRVNIPAGYVGILSLRSSLAAAGILGHVGTIDAGYTGKLGVALANLGDTTFKITAGARVAQLMILPLPPVTYERVSHLGVTDRGDGGFGSTGTGEQE